MTQSVLQDDHARARALLERRFLEPLKPEAHRELEAHLAGCAACRQVDRRLRLAERELAGVDAEAPAPRELDLMASQLVSEFAGPPPAKRSPFAWLLGLGSAAALAAALFVLVPKPEAPKFAPRSGAASVAGVGVFCGTLSSGATPGLSSLRRLNDDGATRAQCPADHVLALTYTLKGAQLPAEAWLVVAGRDAEGRVHWYYPPGSKGEAPGPLRSGQVNEPLPVGLRLDATHALGEVEVTALFSRTPLTKDEILAKLKSAAPLDSLGGDVGAYRTRFTVTSAAP